MATGYVSEEWAKQHHDLWYEKVSNRKPDPFVDPNRQPDSSFRRELSPRKG